MRKAKKKLSEPDEDNFKLGKSSLFGSQKFISKHLRVYLVPENSFFGSFKLTTQSIALAKVQFLHDKKKTLSQATLESI